MEIKIHGTQVCVLLALLLVLVFLLLLLLLLLLFLFLALVLGISSNPFPKQPAALLTNNTKFYLTWNFASNAC